MLIKNTAARLRYIGGIAIGPNETREVPDHWKNALKIEIETGECAIVTPEPVAVPAIEPEAPPAIEPEAPPAIEPEAPPAIEPEAEKPKRGRPAKQADTPDDLEG